MSSILAPPQEPANPPPIALWRNRDYLLLWSGQAVSTLGSGVSVLAFPLLVLSLTGSPAQAGFVAAVFGLPYLVISLPAGAMIDRWNRKRVMILCDAIRAVSMASIPLAAASGHLSIVQIYLNVLIEGTAFVFFNVAEVACLPRVVAKSQLPAATSQNQAAQAGTSLVAPPVGGFLFQTLGRTMPFAIDAVSYLFSVISLLFIKTEFQLDRTQQPPQLRREIAEGVRWLWRQPLIRFMTFLTGGLNFYSNATFLILIVLAKNQGASASLIGIMFAIASVGALAGSLIAPAIQKRYGYASVIITTVWVQALVTPFFAVAPSAIVLGVLGAIAFVTGPIYNTVQFSYRVSLIPDELQGRVNSAVRMVAYGTVPIGSALAGVLLQTVGATRAVLCFAVVGLALAVLASLNPHVRAAQDVPDTLPA